MMEFFQYLAYSKEDVATLLSILRYCNINMFDSKNLDLCMKLSGLLKNLLNFEKIFFGENEQIIEKCSPIFA